MSNEASLSEGRPQGHFRVSLVHDLNSNLGSTMIQFEADQLGRLVHPAPEDRC